MSEPTDRPEASAQPASVEHPLSSVPPMRFDLFVALSRDAAACMGTPPFCRLRRCARVRYCMGKLKRREVSSDLHPGTTFPVWLPLCIARADDEWLEGFITYWHVMREEFYHRPIRPPEANVVFPPLDEQWPHADRCSPEALPPFLKDPA